MKLISYLLLCISVVLMFGSCKKDPVRSSVQTEKEIDVIRRNFSTGIVTIEYTDGTKRSFTDSNLLVKSNSIPDSTLKFARYNEQVWEEIIQDSSKRDYYYNTETGNWDGGGQAFWYWMRFDTETHVTAQAIDGAIVSLQGAYVLIKNPVAIWNANGRQITRKVEVMGLEFYHMPLPDIAVYCEWDYFINAVYTYIPWYQPQTRQFHYVDGKWIYGR